MADMTDDRIKEMEDEMNRFEEEILSSGADGKTTQPISTVTISRGGTTTRYAPMGQPPPMFIPPQLKHRPMPPPPRPFHPMGHPPGNFPVQMGPFAPPVFSQHQPMNRGPPTAFGPMSPTSQKPPESQAGVKGSVIVAAPKIIYSAPPVKNSAPVDSVSPKAEEKPAVVPVVVAVASPPPKEPEKKPVSQPPKVTSTSKTSTKTSSKTSSASAAASTSQVDPHGKKDKKDKKKKYMRMAAGTIWEDGTLDEWDADDFRLFCGDLGNEVTDDVLNRVFAKYPSFQKARVIRDKRTNKTKGYGFASFKDPGDFMKAMRELNGKYVGNRPIKLRKSCWQDRLVENVKKRDREKKKLGFR